LRTLHAFAEVRDRPEYAAAADSYVERFVTECLDTETGLFPWGEHAYWHLEAETVGPDTDDVHIHDHLRQVPLWLWEEIAAVDENAVEQFADALEYHWNDPDRPEYNRHAPIDEDRRWPVDDERSYDFPRHGGHFVFDWSFAYRRRGREAHRRQIERMLDYWWEKRHESGLLMLESRGNTVLSPKQTLSLAATLLQTAETMTDAAPDLAETMRHRGETYVDGFLAAPHDLENGVFPLGCRRSDVEAGTFDSRGADPDNNELAAMPIWGSAYGQNPASMYGLASLLAWRHCGEEGLLAWARAAARRYAAEPFPDGVAVPAKDAGHAVGLFADLYDVTGDDVWLERGEELADEVVERYLDAPLPRGAAGIDWYESQMGPGFLINNLARIAFLARDGREHAPIGANYTDR